MAWGIAQQLLADRPHMIVRSAGTSASLGSPPTDEAVAAVKAMNIDIGDHRSTPLSLDLIQWADVIYTMTQSHRQRVLELWPRAADKTHCLDPDADIEDPIGAGALVYQRTAESIRHHLARRLEESSP